MTGERRRRAGWWERGVSGHGPLLAGAARRRRRRRRCRRGHSPRCGSLRRRAARQQPLGLPPGTTEARGCSPPPPTQTVTIPCAGPAEPLPSRPLRPWSARSGALPGWASSPTPAVSLSRPAPPCPQTPSPASCPSIPRSHAACPSIPAAHREDPQCKYV